ncbi:hypothetical protein H8356DRAFT_1060922 [Neocallimastix lanati (nom. inval.)]|jgi:hypothetical protein|nr:hypothetical protein H8356DRAFT_1060922 [Neocallimastix sp. JGI-2020a]
MNTTIFESKLNSQQFELYKNLYYENLDDRKYFIEDNRTERSTFEWLFSKGTNYSCYIQYLYSLNKEQKLDNTIDKVRTVIYALHKPLQFTFFYWTILLFVLYKFNFKNKILKLIAVHLILRSIGDILDKFGDLWPRYFANKEIVPNQFDCTYETSSPEHYPFRWFLTRQIGCTFWLSGEIVADWYSLIRTRDIMKSKKTIWYVYVSCGLFNISKIALIILHWCLPVSSIYTSTGVYNKENFGNFYNIYWLIQLIIIYASILYDFSVYYVLKKYYFQISNSGLGFVKKFKTYSTYRICVTALFSLIFLPIISSTIVMRLYYYYVGGLKNLDLSFDEIKLSISNLQYFIIFIDQILLSYSQVDESREDSDTFNMNNYSKYNNNTYNNNNNNNSKNDYSNNQNSFSYLNKLKYKNENFSNNNQSPLMDYNIDNYSNQDLNSFSMKNLNSSFYKIK